jgi:hypothetical protein
MNHLFSHIQIHRSLSQRFVMAAIAVFTALQLPNQAWAHAKGMYKTQAEAEKRAKELGCEGTHQNNGLWMPCGGEAMLHRELRKE